MNRYSFEIIRRGFDRFSWVFVEVCEGRRRVLTRADRDFRSRRRTRKALRTLQAVVADAEIIDATRGDDPFDLPATSFEIAPYALPLVVGPPPSTRRSAVGRHRRTRDRSAEVGDGTTARRSADEERVMASAAAGAAGSPAGATAAAPPKAAARAGAPRAARGRSVKKAGRGAAVAPAPARTAEGRHRRSAVIVPTRPASTTAAPVDGWIEAIGVPAAVVTKMLRGLAALDVRLGPRDAPDPPRLGVLVFSTMTTGVANFVHEVTSSRPERILAVSTSTTLHSDDGWTLLHAGAADVFTWRDPAQSARHVAERLRRWRTIDELAGCRHVQEFLVGESPAWKAVLRDAVEVARFTDAAVLVTGESGTGKERVAQLIHELDPRPNKGKLVVLDCSTVVPSLSGSEFFGHEKGAFTGAAASREGAFELANGGTLFLDEVGELTVALQAELLRVIQEGTFKRVGSNMWRKSTFRLVCATNRDVRAEQANGTFRNDFYYRIAGSTLQLPSLRERTADIIPLFRHFFRQVHPDREPPALDDSVRDLLVNRLYPGNVRDLRSLVLRIAHRHLGYEFITLGDVPEQERPDPLAPVMAGDADDLEQSIRRRLAAGATLADITSAASNAAMSLAVGEEQGSLPRAALRLGVPVGALEDWQHSLQAGGAQGSSWRR